MDIDTAYILVAAVAILMTTIAIYTWIIRRLVDTNEKLLNDNARLIKENEHWQNFFDNRLRTEPVDNTDEW